MPIHDWHEDNRFDVAISFWAKIKWSAAEDWFAVVVSKIKSLVLTLIFHDSNASKKSYKLMYF